MARLNFAAPHIHQLLNNVKQRSRFRCDSAVAAIDRKSQWQRWGALRREVAQRALFFPNEENLRNLLDGTGTLDYFIHRMFMIGEPSPVP
ncbi:MULTISPECIES: hypothetical protein [Sphingobium]|uniref:hypothetical protein n=1 Tax=Sphingobium sp. MI1205 TaxID=407020 RepID=UPI0007701944|nr:hypothetical protein [Sphingobium sp. MI1205]AMK19867.1 hypothetical protein K663_17531 [Sphingobium sp. MI1205]